MESNDIQRIKHINVYCKDIADAISCFGNSFDSFSSNIHFQNSVSMSILQIGELSIGLSDEFKANTSEQIQWAPIRAMRNMFAHEYTAMNPLIIWETATKSIPELMDFCEKTIAFSEFDSEPEE